MAEATEEPLTINEAFPPGEAAGEWVLVLSMAMNDLVTLDGKVHDALQADDPDAGYFLRLLCGALRELWRLFDVADNDQVVAALVLSMVEEAREAYGQVRKFFVRPDVPEGEPLQLSWGELYLKDVRDRTFHYPQVGSPELGEALHKSRKETAHVRESGHRPFDFADVVSQQAAFGDISEEESAERFAEIVTKAQEIERLLVPVVWAALGSHLRARNIDPQRLRISDQDAL